MRLVGKSKIQARLNEIDRKVNRIKDHAHEEFRKITPIRTGNARSKTNRINRGVEAAYPYANKLNDGFSRQAPTGMTDPTVEAIREFVRKI
jgi:F0F1-type ATP synthase gamma subunit